MVQPVLLSINRQRLELDAAWQEVYTQMPQGLKEVVQQRRLHMIDVSELRAVPGFPQKIDTDSLNMYLKQEFGSDVIPVVYTDFEFSQTFRNIDGVHYRQIFTYLLNEKASVDPFKAWQEQEWIKWMLLNS